jgi:poly(3-hydroxybutyrate) depolymerase
MTRRSSAAGILILLTFAIVSCNGHPAGQIGTAVSSVRMISRTGEAELLLRPSGSLRGLVVFMHGTGGDQNQLIDDSGLFPV